MIVQVMIKAEIYDQEAGRGNSYWKEVDLHMEEIDTNKIECKSYSRENFKFRVDPRELQRALRVLELEER